ncbi:MAG: hypothetical protein GF333_03465 [Candidatus Omnitrophica bacterium]|nr:hypothetical protein [Candidatus Omnitrophota bacterium]
MKKILILGHSNIGDVCYDAAVIAPLRNKFPQAEISFLTSSRAKGVIEGYPGVKNIILFDRHGKDKGVSGRIRVTIRLRNEKFDLAVVLKKTSSSVFLGIPEVWDAGGKRHTAGHPVNRYLALLRAQGLNPGRPEFNFNPAQREKQFCERFFRKCGIGADDRCAGILPLAAWPVKSWPIEKWNELAEVLTGKYGMKVMNLGKFPPGDLGQKIARSMSGKIISADRTTLAQAMALLQHCEIFIGPDSSFLHLASCMGVETFGLYGPTPPGNFYPYFHRKNILTPAREFSCMPCYPGSGPVCAGVKAEGFGECMEAIEVSDVVGIIEERIPHC